MGEEVDFVLGKSEILNLSKGIDGPIVDSHLAGLEGDCECYQDKEEGELTSKLKHNNIKI